jgi:hypothetical protein
MEIMTNRDLVDNLRNIKAKPLQNSPAIVAVRDPGTGKYTMCEIDGIGHREAFQMVMEPGSPDVPNDCIIMLAHQR